MPDFGPTTLLGTYSTPRFTYDSVVTCEWRGDVVIVGFTNARIPWPVGKRRRERAKTVVLYADLVAALRRESLSAICYWWGVTPQTVTKWRHELGIGAMTEGTVKLKSSSAKSSEALAEARKRGRAKDRDPERRRKISEARKGKPRPDHVVDAVRKAHLGTKHTEETKLKMSLAKKGKPRPPRKEWMRHEDALLGEMSDEEVARKTSRTMMSVQMRRRKLGMGKYDG